MIVLCDHACYKARVWYKFLLQGQLIDEQNIIDQMVLTTKNIIEIPHH